MGGRAWGEGRGMEGRGKDGGEGEPGSQIANLSWAGLRGLGVSFRVLETETCWRRAEVIRG